MIVKMESHIVSAETVWVKKDFCCAETLESFPRSFAGCAWAT